MRTRSLLFILCTTSLTADSALAEPEAPVAVTVTRSREPRSAPVTRYVESVSPAIGAQLDPAAVQRVHA